MQADGNTIVVFSRPLDTGDMQDLDLAGECVFLLFAWGGTVTSVDPVNIGYHQANRQASAEKVCFPQCQPPVKITLSGSTMVSGDDVVYSWSATPSVDGLTYTCSLNGATATACE